MIASAVVMHESPCQCKSTVEGERPNASRCVHPCCHITLICAGGTSRTPALLPPHIAAFVASCWPLTSRPVLALSSTCEPRTASSCRAPRALSSTLLSDRRGVNDAGSLRAWHNGQRQLTERGLSQSHCKQDNALNQSQQRWALQGSALPVRHRSALQCCSGVVAEQSRRHAAASPLGT